MKKWLKILFLLVMGTWFGCAIFYESFLFFLLGILALSVLFYLGIVIITAMAEKKIEDMNLWD